MASMKSRLAINAVMIITNNMCTISEILGEQAKTNKYVTSWVDHGGRKIGSNSPPFLPPLILKLWETKFQPTCQH